MKLDLKEMYYIQTLIHASEADGENMSKTERIMSRRIFNNTLCCLLHGGMAFRITEQDGAQFIAVEIGKKQYAIPYLTAKQILRDDFEAILGNEVRSEQSESTQLYEVQAENRPSDEPVPAPKAEEPVKTVAEPVHAEPPVNIIPAETAVNQNSIEKQPEADETGLRAGQDVSSHIEYRERDEPEKETVIPGKTESMIQEAKETVQKDQNPMVSTDIPEAMPADQTPDSEHPEKMDEEKESAAPIAESENTAGPGIREHAVIYEDSSLAEPSGNIVETEIKDSTTETASIETARPKEPEPIIEKEPIAAEKTVIEKKPSLFARLLNAGAKPGREAEPVKEAAQPEPETKPSIAEQPKATYPEYEGPVYEETPSPVKDAVPSNTYPGPEYEAVPAQHDDEGEKQAEEPAEEPDYHNEETVIPDEKPEESVTESTAAETGENEEKHFKAKSDPSGMLCRHIHDITLKGRYNGEVINGYRVEIYPARILEMFPGLTGADALIYFTAPDGKRDLKFKPASNTEALFNFNGKMFGVSAKWNDCLLETSVCVKDRTDSKYVLVDDKTIENPDQAASDTFLDQFRYFQRGQSRYFVVPLDTQNKSRVNIPIIGYIQTPDHNYYVLYPNEDNSLRFTAKGEKHVIYGRWKNGTFDFGIEDVD